MDERYLVLGPSLLSGKSLSAGILLVDVSYRLVVIGIDHVKLSGVLVMHSVAVAAFLSPYLEDTAQRAVLRSEEGHGRFVVLLVDVFYELAVECAGFVGIPS